MDSKKPTEESSKITSCSPAAYQPWTDGHAIRTIQVLIGMLRVSELDYPRKVRQSRIADIVN